MMPTFTEEQLEAIRQAQEILQHAGLQPADILQDIFLRPDALPLPFALNYIPPKATLFTSEQIAEKENRLTRKSFVDSIVDHPVGAILEYPEAGDKFGMAVAHRFKIDPQFFIHPKENIQYSLGDQHSRHSNVVCSLLVDKTTGAPVQCKQTKLSCRAIKRCSFNRSDTPWAHTATPLDAAGEVFMKTLAFFCALQENGCSFAKAMNHNKDDVDDDNDENFDNYGAHNNKSCEDAILDLIAIVKDKRGCQEMSSSVCNGKLLLEKDKFNHAFVR